MPPILITSALAAPDGTVERIALCRLSEPPTCTVLQLLPLATAEGPLLQQWADACLPAEQLAFYDDATASLRTLLARLRQHRIRVPFELRLRERGCCRGARGPVVQLVDMAQDPVAPAAADIFAAIDPVLLLPQAWQYCRQIGDAAMQTYFSLVHVVGSAGLYLQILLQRRRTTEAAVQTTMIQLLRQLEPFMQKIQPPST
jgi:hypothetical protein